MIHTRLYGRVSDKKYFHPVDIRKQDNLFFGPRYRTLNGVSECYLHLPEEIRNKYVNIYAKHLIGGTCHNKDDNK